MSEEELIEKLCNKFVTGDNYDSRYTDDIYNSIIELDQYKNNWEELKKWLDEEIIINKTNQIEEPNYPEWYIKWNCYLNLLNKMKELEEDK